MKTLMQYWGVRLGLWCPEIGQVYRPDKKETLNPFNPDDKPMRVKVMALKDGWVQYVYTDLPGHPQSSTIESFASYYLKVKP